MPRGTVNTEPAAGGSRAAPVMRWPGRAIAISARKAPILRTLLSPLSTLYGLVVTGRNAYFNRAPGAVQTVGVPVVSVGNITVGGTGKTPMVVEVVRLLRERGHRPVILTRGYGARTGPPDAADEVLEFREALPDTPVVVEADRVAGARLALREHGATCVVLDDGFQHRRLKRDLDVVLIDALYPWGGGRLLPAGRLREPLSGLARTHLVIITRANQVERAELGRIEAAIGRYAPEAPLAYANVQCQGLVDTAGESLPAAELAYRSVLVVCGIGNPETFTRLVAPLAGQISGLLAYRDHHRYTTRDVQRVREESRTRSVDTVVTTRKDWVKLARLWTQAADPVAQIELLRVDVRLELDDPHGAVSAALDRLPAPQD